MLNNIKSERLILQKKTEQQKPWSEATTEGHELQYANELQKAQRQQLRTTIFHITCTICPPFVLVDGIGWHFELSSSNYNYMIDNNTLQHFYNKGGVVFSIVTAISYFSLAIPRWRNSSSAFATLRASLTFIVLGGILSFCFCGRFPLRRWKMAFSDSSSHFLWDGPCWFLGLCITWRLKDGVSGKPYLTDKIQ